MTSTERALAAWGAYDRDDPFPLFAAVRARGPVHPATLADGHAAWLVVGYDEARAALNDPRLSKDMQAALAASSEVVAEGLPGPDFARHMLVVDPPDHTRLRHLVATAFTPRRIEALRPRVQSIVDDLLDLIAARPADEPVDLVASFAFPLPFTVICELLGVPDEERRALGDGLRLLLSPYSTPEEYTRAKAGSDTVVAMLAALVDAKQRRPGDDLVSALVQARNGEERLTQHELRSTLFQLIVAGHDTTTSLIGNGVVALLRHPDELERLRAAPELLPEAVEEMLRYDAPVPHSTFRYATEPVPLGGATIPAGAQVIISLAAANRDDTRYDTPDAFDIERPYVRHLAFGHGIHFCLGAALARMEGQLALGSLLRRFPSLRLAGDPADLHWGHGDGLVLRGLLELPVVPGPSGERGTGDDVEAGRRAMARKAVARRFLDALAVQDFEQLASAFSDDVHLRALLPAEPKEWHGSDRVARTFVRWFGDTQDYELVDAGVEQLASRLRMWWRARLRAERLGEGWFVVEQQAYVDTDDADRIRHVSLVCTGYLAETPAS